MLVLFAALFAYGCVIAPALAVYSWFRWSRSRRRNSPRTQVSLTALVIASASFVLGVASIAASSIHNKVFLYLRPVHTTVYVAGLLMSLAASLVAVVGAFQSNPLRLKALMIALGAVTFWFLAGSGS